MKIDWAALRALPKQQKFWFALGSVCTAIGMWVGQELDVIGLVRSIFVAVESVK